MAAETALSACWLAPAAAAAGFAEGALTFCICDCQAAIAALEPAPLTRIPISFHPERDFDAHAENGAASRILSVRVMAFCLCKATAPRLRHLSGRRDAATLRLPPGSRPGTAVCAIAAGRVRRIRPWQYAQIRGGCEPVQHFGRPRIGAMTAQQAKTRIWNLNGNLAARWMQNELKNPNSGDF